MHDLAPSMLVIHTGALVSHAMVALTALLHVDKFLLRICVDLFRSSKTQHLPFVANTLKLIRFHIV